MRLSWFLFLCWLPLAAAHAAPRPNIVFVIADDCTYLDLGLYGGQAETPHLDDLASEGMIFTRCFQAAPMCSPTRHNLYTGLYPVKSGAYPNHTRVYPHTKSVAHYLGDAGYTVHLSGKRHIAPKSAFPFDYTDEFRNADPGSNDPYPAIERLFEAASPENGDPQPFCLFACSNEPHTPYNRGDPSAYPPESLKLPPTFVDTPETRRQYSRYLAEITYFDRQCGRLLEMLDAHGLRDNTLVIVVSEQGSAFPFAKWTCYEMGLASGMIARWPGRIGAGSSSDALVEYVDVTPTLLDAAGAPVPDDLDGRSYLPVLSGDREEHKEFTYGIHTTRGIHHGAEHYAIRSCATKTHRYIRNLHHENTFANVVTHAGNRTFAFWPTWEKAAESGDDHAERMVRRYRKRPAEELYDVANDPHCLNNLIDDPALADVKTRLSDELDRWMESQGDKGHATEHKAPSRQGRAGN